MKPLKVVCVLAKDGYRGGAVCWLSPPSTLWLLWMEKQVAIKDLS